jgi:putative hydrolase of the HAD superfamily
LKTFDAIIFDLGGVILDISLELTKDAFKQMGIAHFEKMYTLKDANPLFQQLEKGMITEEEFYDGFRISSGIPITNNDIKNCWNALLLKYRPATLHALVELKKKHRIFLLSNTNIIHRKAFNKIYESQFGNGSLDDFFHKAYYSYEIGLRKPDLEAYEFVLKQNNLTPSKTLFIDDSEPNVESAKKAGMEGIVLREGMRVEELSPFKGLKV